MAQKKATKKTTPKTTKKTTKKSPQMWNNISGIMRVWAREYKTRKEVFLNYSTSIGKKNDDGEYDNLYYNVIFKKGERPGAEEGAFNIIVKEGFLTLSVYSDGSVHPAVMVMDYDIKDEDDEDDEDEIPF